MPIDAENAFPIVFNGVRSPRIAPWEKNKEKREADLRSYGEKQIVRFVSTIQRAEQSLEKGLITASEYKNFKEDIHRALDDAWDNLSHGEFDHSSFPASLQEFTNAVSLYAPQLHTCNGKLEKLLKLKIDHPFLTMAIGFYSEIKPLAELNTKLKSIVGKLPSKKTVQQAEREAFLVPPAGTPSEKVLAVLTANVDQSFQQLLAAIRARLEAIASAHPKKMATWKQEHPGEKYNIDVYLERSVLNFEAYDLLSKITKAGGELEDNYIETIGQIAQENAETIRKNFLIKNLKKINRIIEDKKNFKSCNSISHTVNIECLEGTFFIDFDDGSEFYFVNSVVWGWSKYNRRFVRFPLRFHSVKLPGGVKMAQPSEARMHKIFVNA